MSKGNAKKANLNIAIKAAKFIGLEILEGGVGIENDIPFGDFGYQLQYEININVQTKIADIRAYVTVLKKETEEKLCLFETHFDIYVDNLEEVIIPIEGTNEVSFKAPVARIILSICTSTARGMFVMAVRTTPFKNAIIPIINPQNLNEIE